MASNTVVVVGGGIGGVVAARRLRQRLAAEDRVVLVERDTAFVFQPSLLWVMSGARQPSQLRRDVRRLRRRGIEVVESEAVRIDAERQVVETAAGPLSADRIVLAVGAERAPDALPGFEAAALDLYTLDGAVAARGVLEHVDTGRVVVLVSSMPYKCPAAPYEAAFLADAILRRRGVRDRVQVDVVTPEPLPMPTAGPVLGEALRGMLEARSIGFHPLSEVEGVDADSHHLVMASGQTRPFDVLLGVPPHRAPEIARRSGLAAESGYVPVDPTTLAVGPEGIYAIGDATSVPIAGGKLLPKAGVFAEKEAEVVAARIAADLSGKWPTETFDGKGACFVELGGGSAAYATGDFYAGDAPQIEMKRPGRHWHLAKVAFEQYWLRRFMG